MKTVILSIPVQVSDCGDNCFDCLFRNDNWDGWCDLFGAGLDCVEGERLRCQKCLEAEKAAAGTLTALEGLVEVFNPERQVIYNFARPQIDVAHAAIAKAKGLWEQLNTLEVEP